MASTSNVQITIDISAVNPNLEAEEIETLTRDLKDEIKDLVEDAYLVRESEIPAKGKSAFAGFILGLLKAEVNFKNIGALLNFLANRFRNQPIEMTIKAPDGRELSIKASTREEFTFVMQQAREFLDQP